MLRALSPSDIAGVTFVARGDKNVKSYLCTMSFKTVVRKHRKGGKLPYKPADHGLMAVYEVMNLATALKLYREAAQNDIDEVEPQVAPAEQALRGAEAALAAKDIKKNREAVRIKGNKLKAIKAKLALARLKLSDHIAALRHEISQRMENRREEIVDLKGKIERQEGDVDALNRTLDETEDRLAREKEYLADPEQALLNRYRMINLTGLVELTIAGKTYKITTPPVPRIPQPTA